MQSATYSLVAAIKQIGGTIGRISEITLAIAAAVEEGLPAEALAKAGHALAKAGHPVTCAFGYFFTHNPVAPPGGQV
jgi:hypothetical protein